LINFRFIAKYLVKEDFDKDLLQGLIQKDEKELKTIDAKLQEKYIADLEDYSAKSSVPKN